MKDNRPVNLDLTTIKFPLMAIISILHRISGFFLFICIPFLLWAVDYSLTSADDFTQVQNFLVNTNGGKVLVLIVFAGLFYHLVAGIRHLIMDWGPFETLKGGKASSAVVLIIAIIGVIAMGVWLW